MFLIKILKNSNVQSSNLLQEIVGDARERTCNLLKQSSPESLHIVIASSRIFHNSLPIGIDDFTDENDSTKTDSQKVSVDVQPNVVHCDHVRVRLVLLFGSD